MTTNIWGLPLRWRTRIAARPDGGTRVDDVVTFRLPFRQLALIAAPTVTRQLRRIFTYRHQAIVAALRHQAIKGSEHLKLVSSALTP